MDLDQFLENDILTFLDGKMEKKERNLINREEEYGLYMTRDYLKELIIALGNDELSKAKKLFDELKETYNKLPENTQEKKKIYSLLEEMFAKIKDYVELKEKQSIFFDNKGVELKNKFNMNSIDEMLGQKKPDESKLQNTDKQIILKDQRQVKTEKHQSAAVLSETAITQEKIESKHLAEKNISYLISQIKKLIDEQYIFDAKRKLELLRKAFNKYEQEYSDFFLKNEVDEKNKSAIESELVKLESRVNAIEKYISISKESSKKESLKESRIKEENVNEDMERKEAFEQQKRNKLDQERQRKQEEFRKKETERKEAFEQQKRERFSQEKEKKDTEEKKKLFELLDKKIKEEREKRFLAAKKETEKQRLLDKEKQREQHNQIHSSLASYSSSHRLSNTLREQISLLYEEGIYHIYTKNYLKASESFEKILELKPNNKAAKIRLLQCKEVIDNE